MSGLLSRKGGFFFLVDGVLIDEMFIVAVIEKLIPTHYCLWIANIPPLIVFVILIKVLKINIFKGSNIIDCTLTTMQPTRLVIAFNGMLNCLTQIFTLVPDIPN